MHVASDAPYFIVIQICRLWTLLWLWVWTAASCCTSGRRPVWNGCATAAVPDIRKGKRHKASATDKFESDQRHGAREIAVGGAARPDGQHEGDGRLAAARHQTTARRHQRSEGESVQRDVFTSGTGLYGVFFERVWLCGYYHGFQRDFRGCVGMNSSIPPVCCNPSRISAAQRRMGMNSRMGTNSSRCAAEMRDGLQHAGITRQWELFRGYYCGCSTSVCLSGRSVNSNGWGWGWEWGQTAGIE